MPFTVLTGRSRALKARLMEEIRRAAGSPVYVIVPAQFALQAEIDILNTLDLEGSFQIQVLPPERLYARIFEKTGQLVTPRLNDQGRAMLINMQAKKLKSALQYYSSVAENPGFAKRLVEQIAQFKQSGFLPEDVRALADRADSPALKKKLNDLALLYEAYEKACQGHFIDPEDEMREALSRLVSSESFGGITALLFGFDLVTVEIGELALALAGRMKDVLLFLPIAKEDARDGALYEPVRRSLNRLTAILRGEGVAIRREALMDEGMEDGALRHFERELFSWPQRTFSGHQSQIECCAYQNPRREAEACAARIRSLVTQHGYRLREIAVACQNFSRYHDALNTAFSLYGVPIFLAESRPADRHALSVCLLSALRLVINGFAAEDMEILLRTGYLPLETDEADRLVIYVREKGLKGNRLRASVEDADIEPIRAKATEALNRLSDELRASRETASRLQAVYQFLENIGAREKVESDRAFLAEDGQVEWAAEGEQVYTRIITAIDQILDVAPTSVSLRDLLSLFEQALLQVEIRMLPQSGDAVSGGSADHMKSTQVRALFLLGMSDQADSPAQGLLSDREEDTISAAGRALWRLNDRERSRMQKLSVKALLSLTSEALFISYPLSDDGGEMQREGALISAAKKLFGLEAALASPFGEDAFRTKDAALINLPGALRENPDSAIALSAARAISDAYGREALDSLCSAFTYRVSSAALEKTTALTLYGGLDSVSISRLERYARCPFEHFVHYALRPVPLKEFKLSYADAGMFFHRAIEVFTGSDTVSMTADAAARRMDEIADSLLDKMAGGPLSSGAVAKAEGAALKTIARRAARALIHQMEGSRFETLGVEIEFGKDGRLLSIGDSALTGRIDRIDCLRMDSEKYLRVIDYKTGGKTLSLAEIYNGLQLQLTLYLAAAIRALGGRPAGALYFAIKDPLIKTGSLDAGEVESLRAKELRMDGLVVRDERVIRAMAEVPEDAVKVRFTGSGTIQRDAKVIPEEDFASIIDHSVQMAGEHLEGIRAGETGPAPAQTGGHIACEYCDYSAICQFDKKLPGANVRKFTSQKSQTQEG